MLAIPQREGGHDAACSLYYRHSMQQPQMRLQDTALPASTCMCLYVKACSLLNTTIDAQRFTPLVQVAKLGNCLMERPVVPVGSTTWHTEPEAWVAAGGTGGQCEHLMRLRAKGHSCFADSSWARSRHPAVVTYIHTRFAYACMCKMGQSHVHHHQRVS